MYEDIIRDIRQRCRMAMNGVVSTSMREKGLTYKLNFGLTIAQIKNITKDLNADPSLAETLWKEDVRELKIMATLLYPVSEFTEEEANKWVAEIPNQEIREQLTLNLLQNLSFSQKLSVKWANNGDMDIRTTGYWLIARLLIIKKAAETDINSFPFIWADAVSDNLFLRNAALLALKQIGRRSKESAESILSRLSIYKEDPDPQKQEVYDSLEFEFDYYFNG